MKKRCNRRRIMPVPPRGLRPLLDPCQVRDLGLCHVVNVDAISRGEADANTLWQWVGGILTWSRVADIMQTGVHEMHQQLDLAARVIDRYRSCGRVGFSGTDYQEAKSGLFVMDILAEKVDRPTAVAAAEWSQRQVDAAMAQAVQQDKSTQSGAAGG